MGDTQYQHILEMLKNIHRMLEETFQAHRLLKHEMNNSAALTNVEEFHDILTNILKTIAMSLTETQYIREVVTRNKDFSVQSANEIMGEMQRTNYIADTISRFLRQYHPKMKQAIETSFGNGQERR